MCLIESKSYLNRAQCVESLWRDVSTLSSKYAYANYNIEDLGSSAERSGGADIATSSSKPVIPATRCVVRCGVQIAEQMDSRRSIYSCSGAARGRCHVGGDAAGKTAGRSRRACSHPFGGEGDPRNGR